MNRLLKYGLTLVSCFCYLFISGQEGLYDLRNCQGSMLQQKLEAEKSKHSNRDNNVDISHFIYVVDTLTLPFFDDFTSNKIKVFDANIGDNNVSLKIHYDFKVNGQNPVRFEYMNDTTKSIVKTLGGEVVEYANPVLFITFFNNGKPVGADTGWTNVITEFDESSGLVQYDTLAYDELLINTPDTFYKVADDHSLWTPPLDTFDTIQSAPFINNTYARNHLTQGVATFDGTDRRGYPYDITSETSHGEADLLTSKPLFLDSNMTRVLLSFFYQAGGNGNQPEVEDSLVLEFFDVLDSTWRFAWKGVAPSTPDSTFGQQVKIPIAGRKYLRPGFRFRFKNYATLSGSLDHWHLDYIRVGANRDSIRADTIDDVAFVTGISSFLEEYISVPYPHYLADPAFYEASSVSLVASNLGSEQVNMQGLRYEVYKPDGTLSFDQVTIDPNIGPFTIRQTNFPISETSLFPDVGTTAADFEIECRYTATGIGNQQFINDTIRTTQAFRNYYSYDDGTAEKAYALTGAGLRLAYEFNIPIGDSLKAIYFNFPQTLHNENDELPIELLVWDDLDQEPIYVAEQLVEPQYTDANTFFRIKLDKPVFVDNTFYIGFRQQEATKIYIGFDANNDVSNYINYQINGEWFTSSFKGALMIRPHFGDQDLLGTKEITAKSQSSETMRLYPNPANDYINIESANSSIEKLEIFDLSGRKLIEQSLSDNRVFLGELPNGFYVAKVRTSNGSFLTEKFMISRQ